MRTSILILFVLAGACGQSLAQVSGPATLNAAGGTAPIGGNIYDWSIGEMTMVATFTTSNVIVTQGVLQPSADVTAVPEVSSMSSHLVVYPNPASSVVGFNYTAAAAGTLQYRLIDVAGKVILSGDMQLRQGANHNQADLTGLACATYLLEISAQAGGKTESISYKIQKIN